MIHNSIFNPDHQQEDLSSKIVTGLERISEVFRILLWDKAKLVNLSPIQIQLLIFISFHKQKLCNVSHLAKEFNLTKPTISDAVKILDKKKMIVKDYSSSDSRSYSILLSELGQKTVAEINDFANPLKNHIETIDETDLENIFKTLSELIYKLNRSGILTVQRTCYACKFYKKNDAVDYCNLLQKTLHTQEIRLDCPEFEQKSAGQ